MDYDEACFMHLTPGVVHNFTKAMDAYDFSHLCRQISQDSIARDAVVHFPMTLLL